jgi:hypothetical protein
MERKMIEMWVDIVEDTTLGVAGSTMTYSRPSSELGIAKVN